jgi:hypothetical protein
LIVLIATPDDGQVKAETHQGILRKLDMVILYKFTFESDDV